MADNRNDYDIFISYRREGGAQYARILQLMLVQRGYRVFLDYDELKDGEFGEHIIRAIKTSSIFIIVLSPNALDRCQNKGDWVRQEIELAFSEGKKIIPVNPDNKFDGIPDSIPNAIAEAIKSQQHSDISFGQYLGMTVDFMIENRIALVVGERQRADVIDTDYKSAKISLDKQDAHNRFMKRLGIAGVTAALLILIAAVSIFGYKQYKKGQEEAGIKALVKLKSDVEFKYQEFDLHIRSDATTVQIRTIDDIFSKIKPVKTDSLWISQFECTKEQWYGLSGDTLNEEERNMPMAEVSFGEVYTHFISRLNDLICEKQSPFHFDFPSADEWEYAAHGGDSYHETTLYVGSNDPDSVAWFRDNSGGKVHPSDGQQGKTCNWIDLFDMSGNVAEWCNSHYITASGAGLRTVCGGHYNSPASEITADSRCGVDGEAKEKTIGFRVVLRRK